jgi:4-carboxymuconolactone decarboxylase
MSGANRLADLSPQTLEPAQTALLDRITAGRGRLPTPFRVWIHSPELAERMHPLGLFLTSGAGLTKREIEIAVLLAAHQWGAGYMAAVHAREAMDAGLSEDAVAALRRGEAAALSDRRELAIQATVLALAQPGEPSDEVFEEATAALGRDGLANLLALVGYYTAVGLATKMHAVKPTA